MQLDASKQASTRSKVSLNEVLQLNIEMEFQTKETFDVCNINDNMEEKFH